MMRFPLFALFTTLASVSVAASATNLNFEDVDKEGCAVGWTLMGDHFKIDRGEGRNGTVAVRCDCDGKDIGWFFQRPDFEAGKEYRFEGWIRTENLKGTTGAQLVISWNDGKGDWLGAAYSIDVKGTTDGWKHVVVDATISRNAASMSIEPRVGKGATGKVWFDDLSFGPLVKPPIRFLVSDAYRNVGTEGMVTFRLVSNATDEEIEKRGWRGTIRLPDDVRKSGGGKTALRMRELPAPAFTNGTCTFSVNLSEMPFGDFPVSFALEDPKGERVGTATMMFTRVRELPRRRVCIDGQGRTIVGGKPFFPLGMFMGRATKENLDRYAQGPFNCVMNYCMPSRAELDDIRAHGLMSIYCLKDLYRGVSGVVVPMADEADETAYVSARVASLRDHPAILAWYVNDELGPGMAPRLTDRANLIAHLDPNHPTWSVLYQIEHMRSYMPTSDVLGTDPYPIGTREGKIGNVALSTRRAREALFGARPLWQVPQDFDWATCRPALKDVARPPTERELRNMCWQCIAEGANGIVLYSFGGYDKMAARYSTDERWTITCRVASEIRDQFPMLLSDDVTGSVSGDHLDVSVRAWRMAEGLRVLAVNDTEEPRRLSVHVDGRPLDKELPPLGVTVFAEGERCFRPLEIGRDR